MWNKKNKRLNSQRKNASKRRSRDRRRFLFESLESRIMLAGVPTLIDLNPFGASAPSDFTPVGDITYFVADDGTHGRELWKTDGTVQGTALVKDIATASTYQTYYGYVPSSSSPQQLVEFNGELFFVADDGVSGQELWKTDGTSSGTVMVRDINPGSGYQYPYSDGPLQSFPRGPVELNGRLFFSAEDSVSGAELWATDGTNGGTVLVRDIFPGSTTDSYGAIANSSNVQDLVNVNGTLFFTADDGANGRELWKSDGTAGGTVLVKDLFSGTYPYYRYYYYYYGQYPNSSNPQKLTEAGGLLFFIARDANGLELWRSDGTDAGTFMLRDIRSGSGDAFTDNSSLIGIGSTLFFTADDGVVGDELWKSDGTSAGTVLVKDIEPGAVGILSNYVGFTELDGELFFSAHDGGLGRELWKSDGTAAGTVLVKDINPGAAYYGGPNNAYPFYMKAVNGTLYFSALSSGTGRELWQSDGTEAGTVLVADAVPGATGLYPNNLERVGDMLVFSGDDGSGRELWVLQPEAEATTNSARVTIFVNSQQVTIPANIGVNSDGSMAAVFTETDSGEVFRETGTTVTLSDFFEIWRTNAGLAGNNANAILSDTRLLSNVEDATHTVQMFVNGQLSQEFGDYVLQNGDEIVLVYGDNPVVSLNTNFGAIVIELFETTTPGTVDNFLNYVNDGDYINSFFHRSVTDFVIQSGGFTTNSTTFSSTSQFTSVPTDAAIQNEPGISNVRTTVAMAKTSDPDSATSQFFVNLSDDNTFLDDPNNSGGFTVFAQVLDMTTADEIASLSINNIDGGLYAELPISASNQLAVIQSVTGSGDITGVKFSDDNANGVQDSGEAGVAGVSVFVDANDNGVLDPGELSTTTDADGRFLLQVAPGRYTVRSQVGAGKVTTVPASPSSYTVDVEIGREVSGRNFGEADLPAPAGVDLLAGFDSGTSSNDNLTRFNNATGSLLEFEVSGVTPGAEVQVFSDGVQIGSATAASSMVTIATNGLHVLSDGSHAITATQSIGGGSSAASPALMITIDATPPAPLTSTAPDIAQAEQTYIFDADSPDEGQAGIVYSLADAPSGMTIEATAGVVSWTPTLEQAVPQTFAIAVTDDVGNTSSQTVNITVLGVIPAFPETYSVAEDTTLTVDAANGVLANDGDADSGTLSASVVDLPGNGTVTLNPDGSFSYTPNNNFFGEDSFTYRATDGVDDSNVARVTLTVTGVNDAPLTIVDSYPATENVALTVDAIQGVLSNDTDLDGDTLSAELVTQASNGSVVMAADGSFVYTPNANFSGNDSFTYTVSDGTVTSDPMTVSLTVAEVTESANNSLSGLVYIDFDGDGVWDSGESGVPGAQITLSGTDLSGVAITRTVLTTDTGSYSFNDLPAGTYQVSERQPMALTDGLDASTVTNATVGNDVISNLVLSGGQSFTESNFGERSILPQYLSIVWFFASSRSSTTMFRETIARAEELTGNISLAAAIRAGGTDVPADDNTRPLAVADSYATDQDHALTANASSGVLANDSDADGDALTAQLVAPPGNGALTLSADGSFTYTPNVGFTGTDSFSYFASDGTLASDVAVVTIAVNALNTTPVAVADSYFVNEDQTLTISAAGGVLLNDSDADGDLLTAQVVTSTTSGSLTLNADGSFTYTPNADFFGTDTFTYAANDGAGGSAQATATINVNAVNDAPVAAADSYSTDEDTTLAVDVVFGVLGNDTDLEGDTLSAVLIDLPENGALTLNADGSFTYVPNANFNGTDHFSYVANDGIDDSLITEVAISVLSVEDPPAIQLPAEFTDPTNIASRIVGQTVDFTVLVQDPDDSDYVFQVDLEASGIPEGEALPTIDLNTGRFLWTPTATGRFEIRVLVVNGDGEADQETFLIDILPA